MTEARVKEPTSLTAVTLFKKKDQHSMFQTNLCSIQRSLHVIKVCWTLVLHSLCQMQDKTAQEWLLLQRDDHLGNFFIGLH